MVEFRNKEAKRRRTTENMYITILMQQKKEKCTEIAVAAVEPLYCVAMNSLDLVQKRKSNDVNVRYGLFIFHN